MKVVRERIEVKGAASREVELRFTHHGPVMAVDAANNRAFAMRTVWSEPGLAGYFGSARLLTARTWEDFKAAGNAWGAPPLNIVYADVKGISVGPLPAAPRYAKIGRAHAGAGDGRYEWAGFHGKDVLPSRFNPAEGFLATANEMNLPSGYPNEQNRIAFEWTDDRVSIASTSSLAAKKNEPGRFDGDSDRCGEHSIAARGRPAWILVLAGRRALASARLAQDMEP